MAAEDKVVVKELIPKLRQDLEDTANKLREHIGSRGDSHVVGTTEHPGFMDKELYKKLIAYRDMIDNLRIQTEAATLPEGSMLYWPKGETEIPEGFVVCNGYNNTLDMRGRFVMEAEADANYAEVLGRESMSSSELPVPRHTHSFNNYFLAETWKEIQYTTTSTLKNKYYNNRIGSDSTWSGTVYPSAYYPDKTVSTNKDSTASQSAVSIDLTPPFKSLCVIKKESVLPPSVTDGVGSIHIVLSNNIPEGLLELDGSLISRTLYARLYNWAASADLIVSESAWTSHKNKYGSVPYFGESSVAGMIRLPLMRSCLAVRQESEEITSTETKPGKHFHAMGTWSGNNGWWGRLTYSNAPYVSGCTGIFWNGSNHGSGSSKVESTNGTQIFSYPIEVGTTGNGKVCSTNNLTFAIRAYHPEYVEATTQTLNAVKTLAAMSNKAVVVSNPDSVGDNWVENIDGTLSVWGESTGSTIVLPRSMKTRILTVKLRNTNPDSDQPTVKAMTPETVTVNLGSHSVSDTITYYITGC